MPYKDPEKKNEYNRIYYQKNKEKEKQRAQKYKKENDFATRKYKWESRGIKLRSGEDWESIYIYYTICDHCEQCGVTFGTAANRNNSKNLDHDHSTGFVRAVVCWDCNIHRIR
jgi:hypothetical protein